MHEVSYYLLPRICPHIHHCHRTQEVSNPFSPAASKSPAARDQAQIFLLCDRAVLCTQPRVYPRSFRTSPNPVGHTLNDPTPRHLQITTPKRCSPAHQQPYPAAPAPELSSTLTHNLHEQEERKHQLSSPRGVRVPHRPRARKA